MKILIDGFNLLMKKGTGLSTYSKELLKTLIANDHELYCIFGQTGLVKNPDLNMASFIQSLEKPKKFSTHLKSLNGLLKHLTYRSIKANQINKSELFNSGFARDRLALFTKTYNAPALFSVSQLAPLLSHRPIHISIKNSPDFDLFHHTSPLPIKVKGVPNVFTFHDIIPLVLPHSTLGNLQRYYRIIENALKCADGIFVVSENTRKDIAKVFNVPLEKMHVTYQSVEIPEEVLNITPVRLQRFLEKHFNLEVGKYFLFYGAIEPKKNVMKILEAAALAKSNIPMVVAGKYGWLYNDEKAEIERLTNKPNQQQHIIHIGYLPYEQMMLLLKGARALIFPSLYEGFGLPVLEAMQVGVPVITSNVSSLPEIGAKAPLYVNPQNSLEIARAMDHISGDEDLRKEMIHNGLIQAELFSRANHIKRLEEGYNNILKGT